MTFKRFTAREEYFGCLVYDRDKKDYIPFDAEAAAVFRESAKGMPLEEIHAKFCNNTSDQSFKTFIGLCRSIELLDESDRFTGDFISLPGVNELSFLSAPLKVHLQITNECPLRCRHCSQYTRDRLENELTFPEIKSLIDELSVIGCEEINLGGGEPFVSENLIPTAEYAVSKGLSVSLSTSALYVTRAAAKQLSEIGLKQIRISFDGPSEKSYDYLRGKGTYRRAIRGIKTLRELFDIPIILHSVIMKPNLGELLSLFRAVQKLEANVWSIDFILPLGMAETLSQFVLTKEDAALVDRSIKRFSEDSPIKIVMPRFPYKSSKTNIYKGFGCVGGNTNLFISSTGDVKPCSFMPESSIICNMRDGNSIRKIWLDYNIKKTEQENLGNDTCTTCSSFSSCRGGCRARAEASGAPDEPDPLCFLQ